ncbi:hypothetical protein [Nakamurella endophytica]|uniref:hypothetical protein n=1 Tax=Nakamurella endophytica TaxID=1748367 RepID=UPI00166E0A27|nr:hypothetical protein [Nakamurella endophytica]
MDTESQARRVLGVRARVALLVVLAGLVGVLLVRPGGSPAGGDWAATATSVNAGLTGQSTVTQSTAGYLPGTGIVVVSTLHDVTQSQLTGILQQALAPVASALSGLPGGEAVSWQASVVTAGTTAQWLVRVPGDAAATPASWTVAPMAAGSSAGTAAGTTVGTGAGTGAGTTASAGTAAPSAGSAAAAAPPSDPAATGAPAAAAATATSAATGTPAADTAVDGPTSAPTSASASASGSASAASASGSAPAAADPVLAATKDPFVRDSGAWEPLTGSWEQSGGTYRQTDDSGYDFITQHSGAAPAAYTVSVRLRGTSGTMNAGLMLAQPAAGSRQGAVIVDLAGQDYVRWGRYDATSGTYKFLGGAALAGQQDVKKWHTVSVAVAASGCTVSWDGKRVGQFTCTGGGHLGLVSSRSAVEFDDWTVTPA